MLGKIYLIQSNNTLQALSQQPYPNEDLFQGLLEQYPDLWTRSKYWPWRLSNTLARA